MQVLAQSPHPQFSSHVENQSTITLNNKPLHDSSRLFLASKCDSASLRRPIINSATRAPWQANPSVNGLGARAHRLRKEQAKAEALSQPAALVDTVAVGTHQEGGSLETPRERTIGAGKPETRKSSDVQCQPPKMRVQVAVSSSVKPCQDGYLGATRLVSTLSNDSTRCLQGASENSILIVQEMVQSGSVACKPPLRKLRTGFQSLQESMEDITNVLGDFTQICRHLTNM